jgi:PRC-barrel domain protein
MRKAITSAALLAALSLSAIPALAQGIPQSAAALSAVDMKDAVDGYRASKIIGSAVVNEQNETVGKVDDVIVSGHGAREPIVVLSVGGFLGVGTKLVAVRYGELQPNPGKSDFVLAGATKDSLKSLPEFTYAR